MPKMGDITRPPTLFVGFRLPEPSGLTRVRNLAFCLQFARRVAHHQDSPDLWQSKSANGRLHKGFSFAG